MSTSQKTGRGGRDSPGADAQQAQPAGAAAETKEKAPEAGKEIDESEVFREGVGPQYFGSGSYGLGGSTQEGNYGAGESNPQGGVGSFTDAGGYGSSTLYGLEVPPSEESSESNESEAQAPRAPDAGQKKSAGK